MSATRGTRVLNVTTSRAGVTVLTANGPTSQSLSSTHGLLPFRPNRCSG